MKIKNEEKELIASKLDNFEKLRMEVRFLRTFVLFGDSSLDDFYSRISLNIKYLQNLVEQPYKAEAPREYTDSLLKHLHDPKYCANLLLSLMSDYKILWQVCGHLRDFYPLLVANKTSTEYLYPWFHFTADRVTHSEYEVFQCSSKINSLLIDIIPLELEVLHICTSKLMNESRSTELEEFVKKILKASPRILQNYLILIQGCMTGAVAVSYAPTQSINVMIEFLLIFLTDTPKRYIHLDKLNDMLAHVGVLTRKISILVSKQMKESSENNINEMDFSAPYLLQEIEQGRYQTSFFKAPESSQIRFPMDDGLLFMNLLLRHLNDLLISNVYSVALIKKEIGMVKESLEFLRSSFGKVRQTLYETSEHVINSILVRDNALSHLIFSLSSVTDKIKLIMAEVTSLQLEDKNGDVPLDVESSNEPIKSTSSSFVEVTLGHEEYEAWIIDQLLDEHESKLDVISIVRMPGLGKTTLANKMYKNTLVASHFNVHAWCTVSQKFNKVKGVAGDFSASGRVERQERKYLIVLDDVWDIATVEMLISCFPRVERGNRIILTSQSSKVGLQVKCRSGLLYLQLLTHGKSWDLFEKRVFGDQGSCPAELKEKGKGIVQHNIDSFISANNNLRMMKVMQLSYDHLPYHLKSLLLYFGRFQKNKRTPVSKLMQLWLAKGFVDHYIPSKSSLEEITQSYLDALISSSLVMVDRSVSKSSHPFFVAIKVCYVHDVVHDFCAPFHASNFIHRRLTIHTDSSQFHKRCVLFNSNKCSAGSKHLISLKVKNWLDPFNHIRHFGLVRVLQLGNIILKESSMEEIGSLFHLMFQTYVKSLSLSWLNLQNLETLWILNRYSTMVLLHRIIKLSKLKHVSIDTNSFFEEEKDNIMHQPSRILEAECSKAQLMLRESSHFDCNIVEPNDPPTHGNWFPKFDVLNKLESLILNKIRNPNEYHFPTNLKELRLHGFPPRPALFSAIATLPELEILEFIHSDFLQDKWDASEDSYQNLKTLRLANVFLTEWRVDKETFSKLDVEAVEAYTGEERLDVHVTNVYYYSRIEESEEEIINFTCLRTSIYIFIYKSLETCVARESHAN
ncbi:hypothetical protein R3W88_011979 [Solanum pinnatisectum]|uniref:NB-ARC domain-containing protein n=1 Tax=Solanum pinnatisectum TaxID=50273 RepID=A0AAV9L7N1_9SOLN|nr:hypothetical protein R3W88_011979 [Solanum pinnatisectum]